MKNINIAQIKEIMETANILGYDLLPGHTLELVEYNSKGKVKATHIYEPTKKGIKRLNEHLESIAHEQQEKWLPEFMRFIPSLSFLNWSVEADLLYLTVHADNGWYVFHYDAVGLNAMTELLSEALLDQHMDTSNEEAKHQSSIDNRISSCQGDCQKCHTSHGESACSGGCQHCNNDVRDQETNAAMIIWEQLDEEQRNEIISQLSPEQREVLSKFIKDHENS